VAAAGKVEENVTVKQPANGDWTAVKVWYNPINDSAPGLSGVRLHLRRCTDPVLPRNGVVMASGRHQRSESTDAAGLATAHDPHFHAPTDDFAAEPVEVASEGGCYSTYPGSTSSTRRRKKTVSSSGFVSSVPTKAEMAELEASSRQARIENGATYVTADIIHRGARYSGRRPGDLCPTGGPLVTVRYFDPKPFRHDGGSCNASLRSVTRASKSSCI
jgi:hypothetical protein